MALQWDTTKPMGRGQQAPLTPEYQALFEENLRAQAIGAKGNDTRYNCLPQGMPRVMSALFPMEFVDRAEDDLRPVRKSPAAPHLH